MFHNTLVKEASLARKVLIFARVHHESILHQSQKKREIPVKPLFFVISLYGNKSLKSNIYQAAGRVHTKGR